MESQKYRVLSQRACDRLCFVQTFLLCCKKASNVKITVLQIILRLRCAIKHCTHFFIGTFSDLSAVSISLVCAFSKNIVVLVFN